MTSDYKPEALPPEPPKKSDRGWAVGLLGGEICFLLFMAFLMKPIGTLSARDRREVWLFRGCWFGTIALAFLSVAFPSHGDSNLAVTRCIVAVGSALLMWVVATLYPDGYLWRQLVTGDGPIWVWRPAIGGVLSVALGVALLLIIGDRSGGHGLVFSVLAAMGGFMSASLFFRTAFRNFQRSRHASVR